MKKKLLIIFTLVCSFMLYINSVNADEYKNLTCIYKVGDYNYYALVQSKSTSGLYLYKSDLLSKNGSSPSIDDPSKWRQAFSYTKSYLYTARFVPGGSSNQETTFTCSTIFPNGEKNGIKCTDPYRTGTGENTHLTECPKTLILDGFFDMEKAKNYNDGRKIFDDIKKQDFDYIFGNFEGSKSNIEPFKENLIESYDNAKLADNYAKDLECTYDYAVRLDNTGKLRITQTKYGSMQVFLNDFTTPINNLDIEEYTGDKDIGDNRFLYCPRCASFDFSNVVKGHELNVELRNTGSDNLCRENALSVRQTNDEDWEYIYTYNFDRNQKQYTTWKNYQLKFYINKYKNNFKITRQHTDDNGKLIVEEYKHFDFTIEQLKESKLPFEKLLVKSNAKGIAGKQVYTPTIVNHYNNSPSLFYGNGCDLEGIECFVYIGLDEDEDEDEGEDVGEINTCHDLFLGSEITDKIKEIMKIIRIIVPILLLVFGTIDFFKATFSGDEESMKSNRNRFFKRIVAAIIVFIVPVFVTFLLEIANKVWPEISSETCVESDN